MVPHGCPSRNRSKVYHPFMIVILAVFCACSGTAFDAGGGYYRRSYPQNPRLALSRGSDFTKTEEWRQELPTPLNKYRKQTLKRIETSIGNSDSLEIFVIGTCHVLKDSPRDVRLLLETIRPDIIFLELCPDSFDSFMSQWEQHAAAEKEKQEAREQAEEQAEEAPSQLDMLFDRALLSQQRSREARKKYDDEDTTGTKPCFNRVERSSLAREAGGQHMLAAVMDTEPGGEFLAAYNYWKEAEPTEQSNNPRTPLPLLVLGDRHHTVTLAREYEAMTKRDKIKNFLRVTHAKAILISAGAIYAMISSALGRIGVPVGLAYLLFKIDPVKMLKEEEERMKSLLYEDDGDFDRQRDGMSDVISRERDVYMACKLFQACSMLPTQKDTAEVDNEGRGFTAVAVVGAAHVEGMCTFFSELLETQNPLYHLSPLLQSKRLQLSEEEIQEIVESTCCVG